MRFEKVSYEQYANSREGIVEWATSSIAPLAVGIIVAEIGGVLEELVDKR